MKGRKEIEHARGGQQAGTVIAASVGNVRAFRFDGAREKIKAARAHIGDVTERVKGVAALAREDVALHGGAGKDEQTYREENDHGATPHFLQGVAEAGQEPCGDAESEGA